MRRQISSYRIRPPVEAGSDRESVSVQMPDMVSELQNAAFVNRDLQERFELLTARLYRAIAERDWDGAQLLKVKLNAISEILSDV